MERAGKAVEDLAKDIGIQLPQESKAEAIKHRDEFQAEQAKKYTQELINRKYTQMFAKDSVFNDPNLKGATFDNFREENEEQQANKLKARKLAYAYTQQVEPFNTLIVGDAGRGKSHLAVSMLKAVNGYMHDKGKRYGCLFLDVNEVVSRMIDYEFHGGNDRYSRYHIEELCKRADLLVLDDLGTESSMKSNDAEANNMTQKLLFAILNARNNTIITTNLTSAQMLRVYNPKIVSRIKRNINGHVIKFTKATKDMRQEELDW